MVVVIKGIAVKSGGRKLSSFAATVARQKFLLAKHYKSVMIAPAVIDHRGFIKVDEVRWPQPGGAGCGCFCTFHPTWRRHCAGRMTRFAAELFPTFGSSNI